MTTYNDDEMGTVSIRSKSTGEIFTAEWELAGGYVYLRYLDYAVTPARPLPTGPEATARWMLKELVKEIRIGTARKKEH